MGFISSRDPYLNFGILDIAIEANPDSYTDGSSGDTLDEKTEKWPFSVLYVAFDNFFLLWIKIHIKPHKNH